MALKHVDALLAAQAEQFITKLKFEIANVEALLAVRRAKLECAKAKLECAKAEARSQ